MITVEQYFAGKPHSDAHVEAADDLLTRVNALCEEYENATGDVLPLCPNTGTGISGSYHGQGDGGFRLPTATTGTQNSSHKEAKGVDRYDPANRLDDWVTDDILEQHGLYREAPASTPGWCHLSTRAPHSGHRTFQP